ncbi:MAG: tetratricopeptide repeat protein [Alistipes sp.]|nr:tetratricopeptide repeat protein [Alistipes sp.]
MLRKITFLLLAIAVNIGVVGADNIMDVKLATERAISLIEHGRYTEARHSLTLLRERVPLDDEVLVRHIDFELALCAFELRDNEAEHIMLAFLRRYPESVHINDVRFMLAMYYCEREEYSTARKYLEKVSYKALTVENKERYNMRMGYIEFTSGNHDKAYELFSTLSPTGNYADHATYYKAYIHYFREEYKEAYKGFESLRKSDNYAKVIPYYLFQIEFARGNYQYVVKSGDELLKQSVEVERTELMRVIAEAWYRLQGYNKSFLYMSMYQRSGGKMGREENYILGYSAYRSTDYATAIEALRKVAEGSDELAQNASYHLADCYLRREDKRQAIHAFAMAADEKFNNEISEDALFNYGKLLFETGGGTFNESINVLTRYVTKYPNSERADDARELLIAAYYNSHDYKMAYKAIKAFPNPDGTQRAALQKIAYFNGLEAFMVGDYEKAKTALNEAQKIGVSPKYNALCLFWLGEIEYQTENYPLAIKYYDYYLKRAPKSEREYKMALYNLGYAHFTQKSMAKSQKAFEGFVWLYKTADRYRADAFNRLGDAQYSQRKYADAVKSYEGAVALGTAEQDYAKYQRAISLGLAGKTTAKIGALRQMQGENCGDYNDDAAYELGRTYVSLGRYADGASVLEGFVEKYPQSPYYTPALLDLGLVHFNLGDNDKSLHYYDRVISSAPQSSAARDAMQSVREIYVAKGNINDYFAYAERTGVECDLSIMARDSLSFRAAQNIYLADRTADAISHLKEYLQNFPKGYYTNDALFCLSDCYLKSDSLDRAVESMKLLAEQPQNQYTIPVVEKLARVTFDNRIYDESASAFRRMYELAENPTSRMESANGYAESVLLRRDDDALIVMANDLDTLADVDATMLRRVRFAKAKVHTSRGESAEARKIYELLSGDVSNAEGAESAYRVIEALFGEAKLDECEQKIYALADSKTAHSYWLGKAFILLGDIYVQRNDLFQAKATYRSVVDGYTPADDGIVEEAQSKLEKLN